MSESPSVTAVVFDIDGTLCSFGTPLGEAYAGVLGRHGIETPPHLLNQSVKRVWAGFQDRYLNSSEHYRTSEQREREVWLEFATKVLEDAGVVSAHLKNVVEDIYGSFSSPQGRVLEPGVVECLKELRAMGITVVAATNNDARTKAVIDALGIGAHLDGVFVAAELSWKKPSPRYFQAIEARIGTSASAILHVGNHLDLDIVPAQKSGWSAVLYDPKGNGPAPRIGSLSDLVGYIGKM